MDCREVSDKFDANYEASVVDTHPTIDMDCSKFEQPLRKGDMEQDNASSLGHSKTYQCNKAFDYSPTSQQPVFPLPVTSAYRPPSPISNTGSQYLVPPNTYHASPSAASSFVDLSEGNGSVDDKVISILSYGVYGLFLFVLAALTTVFLAVFGT